MAKACLLLPLTGKDLADMAALADDASKHGTSEQFNCYYRATQGLALYRVGDYCISIECLRKIRESDPLAVQCMSRAVEAMAHVALNHHEDAASALQVAERILADAKPAAGDLHDWFIDEVLCHEAQELVGKVKKGPDTRPGL
jgi:hypothetical protein